jgi:hypothetical protein
MPTGVPPQGSDGAWPGLRQEEPFILRCPRVQRHDTDVAAEVTRLCAAGLMLHNSAPPVMPAWAPLTPPGDHSVRGGAERIREVSNQHDEGHQQRHRRPAQRAKVDPVQAGGHIAEECEGLSPRSAS